MYTTPRRQLQQRRSQHANARCLSYLHTQIYEKLLAHAIYDKKIACHSKTLHKMSWYDLAIRADRVVHARKAHSM